MRIIGDVHGKIDRYTEICKGCAESVQVGDLGLRAAYDKLEASGLDLATHRYFGGNHDFYPMMAKSDLGDYGMYKGMFWVRGAESIDRSHRTPGFDLFTEEELAQRQFDEVCNAYSKIKPEIVLSHDCPQFLVKHFSTSFTRFLLDSLFKIHKPKMWIFGHHHRSTRDVIDGCEFVCLKELEFIDL